MLKDVLALIEKGAVGEEAEMVIYYAKSKLPDGRQVTVKEHLAAVAKLTERYAVEIGMGEIGFVAGLFHDFAKYSADFQCVLDRILHHVDHAFSSAAFLYIISRRLRSQREAFDAIITAINGHHDGLVDRGMLIEKMLASVSQTGPLETRAEKYAALHGKEEYQSAWEAFQRDFPAWKAPDLSLCALGNLQKMLRTRMLFSCLVDADYTSSALDEDAAYCRRTENLSFDAAALLEELYRHCRDLRRNSASDPALNALRDGVFEQCGAMGDGPEGLYTLTAPTGAGKTLAMLHFALRHCLHTGKRRIIVVLPFLTLTEQNARVYRGIVGDVLEDHSQSDFDDQARAFTARWSVPFIVTTSVRFFETLFSSKPGECRKMHNIANSVVLFDEAQSLPAELLTASLGAVKELCARYHCTMVFSTATQPAFANITDWQPTEILPDHARLFAQLRRTQAEWRIDRRTPLEEIAVEMSAHDNVCAIVNLRAHARTLFRAVWDARGSSDGLFLLTTDLCPAHRSWVVEEIRRRQAQGLPCLVVATQCIEAGVDLDFDAMYRALAPLESIIQAAGRCNRNGLLPRPGRVVIFEPDAQGQKRLYPDHAYERAAMIVQRMHHAKPIDLHNPEDIRAYYDALYRQHQDKPALTAAIDALDYPEVERQYKLIDTKGYKIIVPYARQEALFHEVRSAAQGGLTPALLRNAAPITVSVFQNDPDKLSDMAEQLYYPARRGDARQASDVFILRPQYAQRYDPRMGLVLDAPEKPTEEFFC